MASFSNNVKNYALDCIPCAVLHVAMSPAVMQLRAETVTAGQRAAPLLPSGLRDEHLSLDWFLSPCIVRSVGTAVAVLLCVAP